MADLAPIIDGIYEAAFVPDRWRDVLGQICLAAKMASGEFQVMDGVSAPRWRAMERTADLLERFIAAGAWQSCERPAAQLARGHAGFLCEEDYLTPEQLMRDPVRRVLAPVGLGWLTGTIIPMPTGEVVSVSFQRRLEDGRPDQASIALLDSLRPHLARAGMIAARMKLERARNTTAAFEAIGLAAAVLGVHGRVLATNALFDKSTTFIALAHGRVAVADRAAQTLFDASLSELINNTSPRTRSIAVRDPAGAMPTVVHLVPLAREAHATFASGEIIVIASTLLASAMIPSPQLLHALFDLTPAEARLASALAAGQSVRAAAQSGSITFATARSYLESIFAKTATHRQSELVSLLKAVPQPGNPSL